MRCILNNVKPIFHECQHNIIPNPDHICLTNNFYNLKVTNFVRNPGWVIMMDAIRAALD